MNEAHGGRTPSGRESIARRLVATAAAGVALALVGGPASAASTPTPSELTGTAQQEWWLTGSLNYAGAWASSTGDNVTVAVIGDEQDLGAQDLTKSFKNPTGFGPTVPAVDTVMTSRVCYATEVSGLIAGHGHSTAGGIDGTVGIAPHAKIMPIVVVPGVDALPSVTATVQAVQSAVSGGAKVIQIDYKTHDDPQITAAVNDAAAHGAIVVAPVGDDGDVQHTFAPSNIPGVLAVAGIQQTDLQYWSSSVPGANVTVAAPATNMLVEAPWTHYVVKSGTACAAALVSGELADLWALHPTWTAAEIKQTVINTASGHGKRLDNLIGYGVVDPAAAMKAPSPSQHTAPAAAAKGGSSGGGTIILAAVAGVVGIGLIALLVVFLMRRARNNRRYVLPEPAPLLNYGPSDYPENYQYTYPYAGPEAAPDQSQPAYPPYAELPPPGPVSFDEQGYTVYPQQQPETPPPGEEPAPPSGEPTPPQNPGASQER